MHIDKITNFLTNLGFRLKHDETQRESVVPGVYISGMTLFINDAQLVSVGDILHEAAHVAIVPSMFRDKLNGNVGQCLMPLARAYMARHPFHVDNNYTEDPVQRGLLQCGESEAIAWSYAAAVEASIPPELVFHNKGYENDGASVLEMLQLGQHFGIHGLAAAKMTTVRTYPTMLRWLQI